MKTSIRTELLNHVIDTIKDQELDSFEDLHFHAFNEDYYIIGHYAASEWLKIHALDDFEVIGDIIDWERGTFGEVNLSASDINPERIVNLYVYIMGERLLSEFNLDQERDSLLIELIEG